MSSPTNTDDVGFWQRPSTLKAVIIDLVLVCIVVAAADLFYENPHPHFDLEKIPAFQAVFGFVAFVVIVMLGRMMRWIVSREEDYYQKKDLPMPRQYADMDSDDAHSGSKGSST